MDGERERDQLRAWAAWGIAAFPGRLVHERINSIVSQWPQATTHAPAVLLSLSWVVGKLAWKGIERASQRAIDGDTMHHGSDATTVLSLAAIAGKEKG